MPKNISVNNSQINFTTTPEQAAWLRAFAEEYGLSVAELLRECIHEGQAARRRRGQTVDGARLDAWLDHEEKRAEDFLAAKRERDNRRNEREAAGRAVLDSTTTGA